MSVSVPPEERGVSPVASQNRLFKSAKARKLAMVCGGVAVIVFVVSGIKAALNDQGPGQRSADTGPGTIAQVTQSPPPAPAVKAPPEPPTRVVYVHDPAPPAAAAQAATPSIVAGTISYVRMPSVGGEVSFEVPAKAVGGTDAVAPGARKDTPAAEAGTKVAFKPDVLTGGKAGPAMSMTYVMRPQLIPCALDTAMDSTLAGAIMCHTTVDVLSQDHVLLMPAGTQIVGTYHNDVKSGQHRLFAFAGSAITKEGIPVPLNSGVADGLGMSGISGEYDPHNLERFGAALALTGLDAAVQLGSAELSKGGNQTLNIGGTVSSGNGIGAIAQEILRNQMQIPPTITVSPGTVVSIVVDHAIDFSDAIKVSTP